MVNSGMSDRILMFFIYVSMCLIFAMIALPVLFIVASSFSSVDAVTSGRVYFWPVEFSLQGYEVALQSPSITRSFLMSVFYTAAGTAISVGLTLLAAYPLSRRDLGIRSAVMVFFTVTMFISGGMIPTYLLVRGLRLTDSVWAILLPGALSVWNMILARTYMLTSIPPELFESASIDGCSDWRYFVSVVLPLSVPIIAVIVLYYAVSRWNAFFDAMIYLNDRSLYPFQLVLRSILVQSSGGDFDLSLSEQMNKAALKNLLQYSMIVISTAPILALYPVVQKYFIKGIMVGSLKG
ncbi:MAG: carbohydrate ABC transporter permease [Clostridiales bacterium]|jgi:putative aldouronate transport system permease protein|nr:carbohydrate ABC transporter permease [Clostridiales bacterium]